MLAFAGFAGSALTIAILGGAPLRLAARVLAVAGAALMLVWVAAISTVVFGEDTYTSDGSSRWTNHGATEHRLYFVSAGVALVLAVLLGILATRDPAAVRVRGVLLLAGIAAFLAGFAMLVAFESN